MVSSSTSGEVVFEENYSSASSVPSWVTGSTGTIENGQLVLSATGGDSNQLYSTIYRAQNGEQLKNFTIDTTYGLKSSTSGKYSVIYLKFSNGVYRQIVFRGTGGVIDKYGFVASNESGPIYSSNTGIITSALTSAAEDTADISLTIGEEVGGNITASLTVDGAQKELASSSTYIAKSLNVGTGVYLEEVGFWQSGNVVAKMGAFKITNNDGATVVPTELPSEVTNVTVANGSLGNLILNWNPSVGADSYVVTAKSGSEEYSYSTTSNSIEISNNLVNGKSYIFTVKAKNVVGQTSGVTSTAFTLDSLRKVAGLTASINLINQINLSWTDTSNEVGYNIYRDNALITSLGANSSSFNETIPSGQYAYKVIPFNNAGESIDQATVVTGVSIVNQNPPAVPTNLIGSAGDGKVSLTWNASQYATSYDVFVNGVLNTNVTSTQVMISNLQNGTAYNIKVRGVNQIGVSSFTNEITVTPIQQAVQAEFGTWFESAFIKYNKPVGVDKYNVYYKEVGTSNYTKVDDALVRDDRADILGLKGNTSYDVKLVGVVNGTESTTLLTTQVVKPMVYDRSGFAFSPASPYKNTNGGYNADGTVKENAVIIYVTNANKDTITGTINGVAYTGLGGIFRSGKTALNATQPISSSTPVIIRIIGEIQKPITGLTSVDGFDIKEAGNITIEGVGEGAAITGFGFIVNKSQNVVIRNLTFSDFTEDAIEIKGATNIWVTNNKFLPGHDMGGDKSTGDGSSDVKQASSFVTLSYNHYQNSGKAALVGQSDSGEFFVTFYQNYLDHSSSRHPRVREGSVHVYNNYYSGVKTYGAAAAENANLLVEGNYFENTVRPMIIGSQGHDLKTFTNSNIVTSGDSILSGETNGAILQRDNYMDEFSASYFNPEYDAGASRTTGRAFNNFQLDSDMYNYTIVNAQTAKDRALANAGPNKN